MLVSHASHAGRKLELPVVREQGHLAPEVVVLKRADVSLHVDGLVREIGKPALVSHVHVDGDLRVGLGIDGGVAQIGQGGRGSEAHLASRARLAKSGPSGVSGGVKGSNTRGTDSPEEGGVGVRAALVEGNVRRHLNAQVSGRHGAVHHLQDLLPRESLLGEEGLVNLSRKVQSHQKRPRIGIGLSEPLVAERRQGPPQPPHVELKGVPSVNSRHVGPPIVRGDVVRLGHEPEAFVCRDHPVLAPLGDGDLILHVDTRRESRPVVREGQKVSFHVGSKVGVIPLEEDVVRQGRGRLRCRDLQEGSTQRLLFLCGGHRRLGPVRPSPHPGSHSEARVSQVQRRIHRVHLCKLHSPVPIQLEAVPNAVCCAADCARDVPANLHSHLVASLGGWGVRCPVGSRADVRGVRHHHRWIGWADEADINAEVAPWHDAPVNILCRDNDVLLHIGAQGRDFDHGVAWVHWTRCHRDLSCFDHSSVVNNVVIKGAADCGRVADLVHPALQISQRGGLHIQAAEGDPKGPGHGTQKVPAAAGVRLDPEARRGSRGGSKVSFHCSEARVRGLRDHPSGRNKGSPAGGVQTHAGSLRNQVRDSGPKEWKVKVEVVEGGPGGLEGAQVGPVVVLCAVLYSQRVHIPLEVGEEGYLAISWLGKVLRAKIGKVHLVPVEVEREP